MLKSIFYPIRLDIISTHLPNIYLSTSIDFEKNDARIVAYEESAKKGESGNLFKILNKKPSNIIAIFGPEGGISPKEIEFLEANSFILAGLGPRIMRAETAPLYFLASLSFALELSWD